MDNIAHDAREWRLASECTFLGAMTLFRSKNFLVWFPAAVLGHLALEQLLKSALTQAGCPLRKGQTQAGYAWGHKLVELAQLLASKQRELPTDVLKDLAVFDAFFGELRYPQTVELVEELGPDEGDLLSDLMESIRPFAATLPPQWSGNVQR
jgi:hypothetical protein